MIRAMIRSVIFLVLLCSVGGYLFYLKTGTWPIPSQLLTSSGSGDGRIDLRRLSDMPSLNSVKADEQPEKITKWQDEKGVWHFSNE
jgi:hypothetical protein